jgi:hypothetical protein
MSGQEPTQMDINPPGTANVLQDEIEKLMKNANNLKDETNKTKQRVIDVTKSWEETLAIIDLQTMVLMRAKTDVDTKLQQLQAEKNTADQKYQSTIQQKETELSQKQKQLDELHANYKELVSDNGTTEKLNSLIEQKKRLHEQFNTNYTAARDDITRQSIKATYDTQIKEIDNNMYSLRTQIKSNIHVAQLANHVIENALENTNDMQQYIAILEGMVKEAQLTRTKRTRIENYQLDTPGTQSALQQFRTEQKALADAESDIHVDGEDESAVYGLAEEGSAQPSQSDLKTYIDEFVAFCERIYSLHKATTINDIELFANNFATLLQRVIKQLQVDNTTPAKITISNCKLMLGAFTKMYGVENWEGYYSATLLAKTKQWNTEGLGPIVDTNIKYTHELIKFMKELTNKGEINTFVKRATKPVEYSILLKAIMEKVNSLNEHSLAGGNRSRHFRKTSKQRKEKSKGRSKTNHHQHKTTTNKRRSTRRKTKKLFFKKAKPNKNTKKRRIHLPSKE